MESIDWCWVVVKNSTFSERTKGVMNRMFMQTVACRAGKIFLSERSHHKSLAAILNFSCNGRLGRERKFYQGGE